MISGNLFTRDYLLDGIERTARWKSLTDKSVEALRHRLETTLRLFILFFGKSASRALIGKGCIGVTVRNYNATAGNGGLDQKLHMLGTIGGERQELGHGCYCVGPVIMPAATVLLVASSMRMKLPVSRLRR